MSMRADSALDFIRDGVEMREGLVPERDLRLVASEITVESAALGKAGIRNLEKKVAGIARLAADPVLVGLAREFLGGEARLVRALFFDKTPGRNWAVPWHQDKDRYVEQKSRNGWMGSVVRKRRRLPRSATLPGA
jgi:hypothetical protein